MSSPGKVISRTHILNRGGARTSTPMTNVVDVNIQRIRAKLHWTEEGRPIKTIRG